MFIQYYLLFLLSMLLCQCSILPGMGNLNTRSMQMVTTKEPMHQTATLIPITASLLLRTHKEPYRYLVAPADVLRIRVWQHPEFSINEQLQTSSATSPGVQGAAGQDGYVVQADGTISLPLIETILVQGKTVAEIRKDITARLREFIPHPHVYVRIADYRGHKVYVLGEVTKPGFVPISDQPLTIADALAFCQGMIQETSDPRHVYVIRGNYLHPAVYWLHAKTPDALLLAEHFPLLPLDILYVSSAPATRWNRALNQLLPTIQTIWYTKSIVSS